MPRFVTGRTWKDLKPYTLTHEDAIIYKGGQDRYFPIAYLGLKNYAIATKLQNSHRFVLNY